VYCVSKKKIIVVLEGRGSQCETCDVLLFLLLFCLFFLLVLVLLPLSFLVFVAALCFTRTGSSLSWVWRRSGRSEKLFFFYRSFMKSIKMEGCGSGWVQAMEKIVEPGGGDERGRSECGDCFAQGRLARVSVVRCGARTLR
jgi:hypothetical protein